MGISDEEHLVGAAVDADRRPQHNIAGACPDPADPPQRASHRHRRGAAPERMVVTFEPEQQRITAELEQRRAVLVGLGQQAPPGHDRQDRGSTPPNRVANR